MILFDAGPCPISATRHPQSCRKIKTLFKKTWILKLRCPSFYTVVHTLLLTYKYEETYPVKSKGLEGWKEASMTEARWPLSTATGSGVGLLLIPSLIKFRVPLPRKLEEQSSFGNQELGEESERIRFCFPCFPWNMLQFGNGSHKCVICPRRLLALNWRTKMPK